MKDFAKEIWAYALKNSIEFEKADAGRILPKLFLHGLNKKDIKKIMPEVQKIVSNVNKMEKEERKKEFGKFKKYVKERKEKEEGLPELPEVSDKMVFRVAPFPSGALHIGNAKTYLLNALYAEKYSGKIILVMDDTIGSEEKQITPDAYRLIEEGFRLLEVKYERKIEYKSERLEIYYEYGEQLLKKGASYICTCLQEELRENRAQGRECACRGLSVKEQEKRWKAMFTGKQGSAVMRLKTSMQHPNPAFRDRVLFKISNREHPRVGKKYRVWPTLEMSWAIDDHLLSITHIIRGNDLMIESDMEKFIWDIFGWKHLVLIHTGLVKIEGIEGAKLSKSKAQKEVASGEFSGWDDPRTWSIQSLIRRGIKTWALRKFIEEIGLNKQDIAIPIEALYAINRRAIDAQADRYTFIEEPREIKVKENKHIIKPEIEVQVHPDRPNETRVIKVGTHLYLSRKDVEEYKGKEIRLLHLCNIKLDKNGKKAEVSSVENKDIPRVTWVSSGQDARVLMPDGKWLSGIADEGIFSLKEGDIIQFERFGFCRCDKAKPEKYEFWFAHK